MEKINHDAIQHSWPTRWSVDIVDVQVMSLQSLQVVSVFHSLQISKFNVWFQLFDIMPHHNKNVRQIEGSTCQSLPLWLNAHRISHHCRSDSPNPRDHDIRHVGVHMLKANAVLHSWGQHRLSPWTRDSSPALLRVSAILPFKHIKKMFKNYKPNWKPPGGKPASRPIWNVWMNWTAQTETLLSKRTCFPPPPQAPGSRTSLETAQHGLAHRIPRNLSCVLNII